MDIHLDKMMINENATKWNITIEISVKENGRMGGKCFGMIVKWIWNKIVEISVSNSGPIGTHLLSVLRVGGEMR
jgi:hypothetical protein